MVKWLASIGMALVALIIMFAFSFGLCWLKNTYPMFFLYYLGIPFIGGFFIYVVYLIKKEFDNVW
jgi:hypothetical protein